MAVNNNQNIISENNSDNNEETASSIVSIIIKKYNLKDFDAEAIEKLKNNEPFIVAGPIINGCAKKIALSTISDNDAKLLLENGLGIQKEKSKELLEDIKIKIVPIIQKALKMRKNEFTQNGLINNISQKDIMPLSPIREDIEEKLVETNNENIPPIKKRLNKKVQNDDQPIEKKPSLKTGPDSYREPIE